MKEGNGGMKKIAIYGAAIACALTLAACTDEQKCRYAKYTYDKFVESGRGGAEEKAAAKKQFDAAKKRCADKGITI